MQLIIVLVIVLLLFGAKKIPELAKGLGTGMREFRAGASGEIEDDGENKDNKEGQGSRAEDSADESGESQDGGSRDAQGSDQSADKTEQRS